MPLVQVLAPQGVLTLEQCRAIVKRITGRSGAAIERAFPRSHADHRGHK